MNRKVASARPQETTSRRILSSGLVFSRYRPSGLLFPSPPLYKIYIQRLRTPSVEGDVEDVYTGDDDNDTVMYPLEKHARVCTLDLKARTSRENRALAR